MRSRRDGSTLCVDRPARRAYPSGFGHGDETPETFFELKVRPVLVTKCLPCHGGKKTSSGLKVDSRESLLRGGDRGPAIVPGEPGKSLLIQAVRRIDDDLKMPPEPPWPGESISGADRMGCARGGVAQGDRPAKPPARGGGRAALGVSESAKLRAAAGSEGWSIDADRSFRRGQAPCGRACPRSGGRTGRP